MKNFVKFNVDYFKKTIYEYQDWEFAFCRETAQNSCDAQATRIYYTIEDNESGDIIVTCDDNGTGMNENILLNRFLVMGESHKTDKSAVGGFGYAKGIILFCHKSYIIHTNNLLLKGSYGQYDDPIKTDNKKGTKLIITMDADMTSAFRLKSRLREWVFNSSIDKVKFYLNGEELEQSAKKFDYKKKTKIGDLMLNEADELHSTYSSSLWIRMRGMAMFRKNIYSDELHFNGYIDLDGKSSIECLTANRDGLKNNYEYGLSELIKYLSSELSSLKCSKMDDFEINNYLEKERDYFKTENNITPLYEKHVEKTSNNSYRTNEINAVIDEEDRDDLLNKAKKLNGDMQPKIQKVIEKIDNTAYPSSFLVKIDNLDGKGNRDILKEYNKAVRLLNQSKIKKTSQTWMKIVNGILQACYDNNIGNLSFDGKNWIANGRTIHYGAILSENSETFGMCSRKDDKYHVLFNPITIKEKDFDNYGLMLIAVHEVAHVFEMSHGEYHSYLMFVTQYAFHKSNFKINKIK